MCKICNRPSINCSLQIVLLSFDNLPEHVLLNMIIRLVVLMRLIQFLNSIHSTKQTMSMCMLKSVIML